MSVSKLQQTVERAWQDHATLTPATVSRTLQKTLEEVLTALEEGRLRAATSPGKGQWEVHPWIKQAILLYFRTQANQLISSNFPAFDKIPLQFTNHTLTDWQDAKVRLVPPACVRRGAYIGPNTILMPSYVNIGAHVGEGTLVDTWATVGSCAQIGKHVHLSGGAGIGGVLEPLQATPTIIEDHCFIGARSEIVEGIVVEEGSVIGMGVYIGQSTRIYDRETDTLSYGRIPPYSVVVSGSLPSQEGKCHLYAAVIVKKVDKRTREKTAINKLLRDDASF